MDLLEDIKLALRAIRSNLLRASLTILIIAFGIMALVGILTSIDGIKAYITSDFSNMGANTFNIRNRGMFMQSGERKVFRPISFREAEAFKERYSFPSIVSMSTRATSSATIKYGSRKTHPNVKAFGVDGSYIFTAGLTIEQGRNFSNNELRFGSHAIIIGHDIRQELFPYTDSIISRTVTAGSTPYRIVGVLQEKGASGVFSPDNVVLMPVNTVRRYYSSDNRSYIISVSVPEVQMLETAIGEAKGTFRGIRKVELGDPDNFEVVKSDGLANMLIDNLQYVTLAATVIGLITLLGASVGLMNILLVAVSERTREIGLCKAIGATSSTVKRQFLIEAIVVCQLGGIIGIVLGIGAGNAVSYVIGGNFIIPWKWMLSGVLLCLTVGVVAGIYPAIKASKLNPIDALRYE